MARSAPGRLVRLLAAILGLTTLFALASQHPTAAQEPDLSPRQRAECLAGDARSARDLRTGAVRFIGTDPGRAIPHPRPFDAAQSREAAARAYLSVCGSLFGVQDEAAQLTVTRITAADGQRSVLRFQQVHGGLPIIGGELIVHLDNARNVLAVAGKALPTIVVGTTPTIDAATAAQTALDVVAQTYGLSATALTATAPTLSIYDPMLIGPASGSTALVWRMDVVPRALLPIRELVLIDAHRGSVTLHFNQVDTALNRQTYTANNTTTLPGTLVCDESNPSCTGGDAHAAAAHLYGADTYNFYLNNHGRDGIDNAGMPIRSTVHYGMAYVNAFWNGAQMAYGDGAGFALADDVVAHELTHGVTQYTSNLFYYYQSGAINESFSDVWGELIDQTNGRGNDDPGVKWLMGEDVAGLGAIRSMNNPPAFSDPDRMTSLLYSLDESDNGGVHTNSGVNNKAAYLMVDGGTFNGQTVIALGVTKVAKIYYEVQTHLLTSGSNYGDLYDALYQGCNNLVGTAGITSADCEEVRRATIAVEMNLQPGAAPTGRVISSATSAGLANVWVQFYTGSGSLVSQAPTDASGNYTVDLAPGTYYARTTYNGQGYINEIYDNIPCGPGCNVTAGTPIIVTSSGASGINFALDAGVQIAGTVKNAATTAAIANLWVLIFNGSGEYVGSSQPTDASGQYVTDGVPTGSYFARTLNSLGYVNKAYHNILCNNCNVTTTTPIPVGAGPTISGIDFALDTGGRLAGRVTAEANGAALLGGFVDIFTSSGSWTARGDFDASGNYTSNAGLPTGAYYARARNFFGYVDELYNNITCLDCNVTTGTPISVTAGSTTGNIDFALAEGGRISGVVTQAAGGAPIAHVEVDVYNTSGQWMTDGFTDASGNYTTNADVPPGTYFARTLSSSGLLDKLYDDISCVNCNPTSGTPISVAAGATTSNINFALTVGKTSPTITWPAPADIVSGTALTGAQLNATANVPGTFVYTPALGTVLDEGSQTLSVTFTPSDATNYASVTMSVAITVRGVPRVTLRETSVGPTATVEATIANGPGNATDWVALYAPDGTRLDWKYLNGTKTPPATGLSSAAVSFTLPMTPGTCTLRLHPNNGYTVLASATVTVGGITFIASPTTPGGTVTATLSNGPGNAGDWVALFAADGSRLTWKYLNGTQTAPAGGLTSANVPFTLPTTAGTYTLRLYANYSQTLLATTEPITVAAPAAATVTVTPTTIPPGGTVSTEIAFGPGNAADWVAVYAAGGSTYLDWKYLNGTRTVPASGVTTATVDFTMPPTPGTYTVQFYQDNTYTLLASSVTITVASVTLTVDPVTAAPGATVQAVIAGGPGNATDWVALFAADGVTRLDWKYLDGSQTPPATGLFAATVPFTPPATPGVYTVRWYAKNTQTVLASATITVTLPSNN